MNDRTAPTVKAVVFDFDLTLADSSAPVVECVNYGLRGLGLPEASADAIKRTIGLHLSDTLVVLAGERQRPQAEKFQTAFVRRADEVMAQNTHIFRGVPGVLDGLKRRGYKLGIVSTKYRYRIEAILERDGLLGYFDNIVGGEDVQCHKPAPDSLLLALNRLSVNPHEVLYVGDSVTDAMTAQAAGVKFVAVLSGATPPDEFDRFPKLAILPGVQRDFLQNVLERNPNGDPQCARHPETDRRGQVARGRKAQKRCAH